MANALNEDITNRHVVIKAEHFSPAYRDIKYRVFLPKAGFGCQPFTIGTGVIGVTPYDMEEFRIEGSDIERYATDAEIALVYEKEATNG